MGNSMLAGTRRPSQVAFLVGTLELIRTILSTKFPVQLYVAFNYSLFEYSMILTLSLDFEFQTRKASRANLLAESLFHVGLMSP